MAVTHHRASKELCGIAQAHVRFLVYKHCFKPAVGRLGKRNVGKVAVADDGGGFAAKKLHQRRFEFVVRGMVACGHPRRASAEPIMGGSQRVGLEQLGMTRETIVVASAKVDQPFPTITHVSGIVRLDGCGQTHGLAGGGSSFCKMLALSSANCVSFTLASHSRATSASPSCAWIRAR